MQHMHTQSEAFYVCRTESRILTPVRRVQLARVMVTSAVTGMYHVCT